ncbi:glycosyltransferase family 92 protein [Labrys neptuniae]
MEAETTSIRKAVVAVLLAREHLPFIRGWVTHHLAQGWEVFLYDNTGSQGSSRKSSVFSSGVLQSEGRDKRGNRYLAYTRHLSDTHVIQALRYELADLPVTIKAWRPLDENGVHVHGQVEAYVDFIQTYRNSIDWAVFVDADEYLEAAAGWNWQDLIEEVEAKDCFRIHLGGHHYESRWSADGHPRPLDELSHCGLQIMNGKSIGGKNLVKLSKVIRADIHWNWVMSGVNKCAIPNLIHYYFKHYNALPPDYLINYVEFEPDDRSQPDGSLPV